MSGLHVPEITLRRIFVGEVVGADADGARRHANECGACKAKLRAIEEEQAKFQQEISFDRFKAGVERAARGSHGGGRSPVGYMIMAAAAMLTLMLGPLIVRELNTNRTKGSGVDLELFIKAANEGPQRVASPETPELLSPGDRIRIGYAPNGYQYVTAVSVDEAGEITALYPESGLTPKLPDAFRRDVLPGAWEMTGKGSETIVVIFSDGPLDMNDVIIATKDAYERAGGRIQELPKIFIPGLQIDQKHRTVLKP